MPTSCTDCNNIFPITNITTSEFVVSDSYNSSVRFQTNRVLSARTDCNNIFPIVYVTFSIIVFTSGNNRTIHF